MQGLQRISRIPVAPTVLTLALSLAASGALGVERTDPPLDPTYDTEGRLLLPEGYEQWIFVGSSLALSYTEGAPGHEMFHHVLMEPSAYGHFRESGEFREGTMLALLLHGTGEQVLPARGGRFASAVHAVELAVKDSGRVEETWAYYNFGGGETMRDKAQPMPAGACQSCHAEHAAHDNVFLQFYPLLVEAAPEGALPAALPGAGLYRPTNAHAVAQTEEAAEVAPPVALGGNDPVHLVEGREELGKPEIIVDHGGFRYYFVSEPTRKTFAESPDEYAIANESCPVVPGAPIDPSIFSVHEGEVYAFATPNCKTQFDADPESFVGGE